MKFLSEGGLPCWVTGLAVRYDEFPQAVFLYHIMCYTVGYYVGISGQFFFRRSQPFCSVGFPVRLSARASSVNC